jgi:hypothetical protein
MLGKMPYPVTFSRNERLELARRLIRNLKYNDGTPIIPKRVIDVGSEAEGPSFTFLKERGRIISR